MTLYWILLSLHSHYLLLALMRCRVNTFNIAVEMAKPGYVRQLMVQGSVVHGTSSQLICTYAYSCLTAISADRPCRQTYKRKERLRTACVSYGLSAPKSANLEALRSRLLTFWYVVHALEIRSKTHSLAGILHTYLMSHLPRSSQHLRKPPRFRFPHMSPSLIRAAMTMKMPLCRSSMFRVRLQQTSLGTTEMDLTKKTRNPMMISAQTVSARLVATGGYCMCD